MLDETSDEIPLRAALDPSAILPSHEASLGAAGCVRLVSIKTCNLINVQGQFGTQIEERSGVWASASPSGLLATSGMIE